MIEKDIYKTKTYDYYLPEELIAQHPAEKRDESRLLVYHKDSSKLEHKVFKDIVEYFRAGDVLVLNNTKVLPARLMGKKVNPNVDISEGANIEVLLLKRIDLNTWETLVKPGKRAKVGTKIWFSDELSCVVVADTQIGGKIVRFEFDGVFEEILIKVGTLPLPPYIKEKPADIERYQTVFAKTTGSSAAPTAGLHFTPELLQKLKDKGVIIAEVLLHVGLGTFRPVSEENILKHDMHTEYIEVNQETADILNKAKREGRRIIACGTTSVRTLESVADENGVITPQCKNTNIFIYPGYKFRAVDGIITNFHLPQSTLLMLVSAFIGIDNALNMYNVAVKEKYRFFSFGDATLLI